MKNIEEKLGISIGDDPAAPLNRRDFLKISGITGTGLLIGLSLADSKIVNAQTAEGSFEPSAFLSIDKSGKIVIMAKNPEIGQGVKTSLPQIIAEELEVRWDQVEVRLAPLDDRLGDQFAGGSTAVNTNFELLRKAGATAREMLIEAASKRWNVSTDQCVASEGVVSRKGSSQKFTYGELAEDAAKLTPPENPTLKNPQDFKLIGKPIAGVDNKGIVNGTVEFGLDARPKGMLVASIERCPYYGGSVASIDDSATLKVSGVQKVIKVDATANRTAIVAGVAVIATNTWAAFKGRKALKIIWNKPSEEVDDDTSLQGKFDKNISEGGTVLRNDGNVDQAWSSCKKIVEGTYEVPFLAHAPMEPQNYIADVRSDEVNVWGPTQVPGRVRGYAAALTGVAQDKINVRMTRVGGGFGRRLMADYAAEAIFLSKELSKPVQVVWTREDDLQHDFYRPAGKYKLKAGLDANNKLIAWQINASTASRGLFSNPKTENPSSTEVFPDGFPAGFVPNFKMEYSPIVTEVPRGAWRAPGHNVTAWIDQSFIDELADLAGKDPIDFRLTIMGEDDKVMPYRDHGGPEYSTKRLKNVIREVAEKSNWNKAARKGIYRGFACHFMFGAYVAEVIEISMPEPTRFKVEKVYCVVDCGMVINKSGAMNQLEGGVIDGLSAAIGQAIHIEDGKARESNFNNYTLLRMKDAPPVEAYLVESTEKPEGLGEMTLPTVAAALCNAIYKATGKRVRKLPISLDGENAS